MTEVPSSIQVERFVQALAEQHKDISRFKLTLRDFLISLKEFSGDDNAELYLEEKETEAQQRAQTERAAAMRIPGMLKPSQLEDKDEDLDGWGFLLVGFMTQGCLHEPFVFHHVEVVVAILISHLRKTNQIRTTIEAMVRVQ